jgi:predicted DNA-binding protein with PD1-like motif
MRTTKAGVTYVIRIDKGEEVVKSLTEFCAAEHIKSATFTGIGAVEWLKCGYYALDEKKYYFKEYDQLIEVVSLTGNVMQKDSAPTIHVHGVFTDTTNTAFGGHIVEMRVGVVLEVMLTPLQSSISRTHDDCIGLYLLNIEN